MDKKEFFRQVAVMYGYSPSEVDEFLKQFPDMASNPPAIAEGQKQISGSPMTTIQAPKVNTPQQSLKDLAKQAGYSDEEINTLPIKPIESNTMPNAVSPFYADKTMSQTFNNYNPGMGYANNLHKGEDFPGQQGEAMRTPIGGQVVANEWDPAYGYTTTIKGLNPQEYNQLSPEDRSNPMKQAQEDAVKISHMAQYAPFNVGEYVATGSGGLKMGTTGNSTGVHTDIESFPVGSPNDYSKKKSFTQTYLDYLKGLQ